MSLILAVTQSPQFGRQKKKLRKPQIAALDQAVKQIMLNPLIGEKKVGDLQGIRVYKFTANHQQCLVAYEAIETTLYLYAIGAHENFYRDLKKYRTTQ